MTTVAIVSGGMDSVTLAHLMRRDYERADLVLVSFNYGQRHVRELDCAAYAAEQLGAEHQVIDLSNLTPLIATSALTSPDVDVPDGHYAEDTMKTTVVPNRNAIMIAVATGVLVARGGGTVAVGVHAGDHFIYPDCRPLFIGAMADAMRLGSEGLAHVDLIAPFIGATKAEIAAEGHRLGVDWSHTWSCYKGGDVHCGTCGTCTERREAFELAGVDDPTEYADLTRNW